MTTLYWENKYEIVDNTKCSNDIYQQPIHEIIDNVVFVSRQWLTKIEDTELYTAENMTGKTRGRAGQSHCFNERVPKTT